MSTTRMSSPVVISIMPLATMFPARLTSDSPVVVGLGANLGQPVIQLANAARELALLAGGRAQTASLYRSAPIGPTQPDFFNSAVALDWPGSLEALLDELLALETRFGRERNLRWGPRTLDLDLLWARERTADTTRLVVPHPRLALRAFALLPLLELFPDASAPHAEGSYDARRGSLHSQRIERIGGPEWLHETLRM